MSAPINSSTLVSTMVTFHRELERHQAVINRLNVFPVPDGDTGTNMTLTLGAVVDELIALGVLDEKRNVTADAVDLSAVCKAVAHGSLMGARGNSGVILCQLLRGLVGALDCDDPGAAEVVSGLRAGDIGAREAVLRPTEGTILTVARAGADGAAKAFEDGPALESVLAGARLAAVDALFRTPEQLPVLAEAGVVDAGGAGFILLFDSLLKVLCDQPLPADLELPEVVQDMLESGGRESPRVSGEPSSSELRYEVMYFLEASDETIPAFRDVWAGIGDSIVVVGGEGLWNCHIHTDDVGAAIEAALDVGRPRNIRVTDLIEQVEEEQWVRQGASGVANEIPVPVGPAPVTSVVAVATGEGIGRIFHSLGVEIIVSGGQSMNPSTAQILEVVERARGTDVVILPNNSNIIPVARQVVELSSKSVHVVATRGIQEGFAALLDYDPGASGEENARSMTGAAEGVIAGEVTQAVRATSSDVGPIEVGSYIGLSRSGIEAVAPTLSDATCALIERLITDTHEIVTLIEGAETNEADTRRVTEYLGEAHPKVSVERHHGGQPLYPYLISIE